MADSGPVMQMAVLKHKSHYGRECGTENKRTSAILVNEDMNCNGSSFF